MEAGVAGSLAGVNVGEVASSVLCEFLEVAFHLILYTREIYPPVLFERRRKYNVPVQMCVHPELNQYIRDILVTVRSLMEKGAAKKVELVVHDKQQKVMEKFVFMMQGLSEQAVSEDGYLLRLEADLRAILLKISVCDALLQPNPPGCTFSVLVHTTESAAVSMEHLHSAQEFPWVTAADDSQADSDPDASIVPIKSISSSILKLQLYVDERPSKTVSMAMTS